MDLSVQLIGHNRIYELENIIREVFLNVNLDFNNNYENKVISKLDGKVVYTNLIIDGNEYNGFYEISDNEPEMQKLGYAINKSFIDCVKKYTDVNLPWGILVGIKPSKKVEELRKYGYSNDLIRKILKEKFLISENKIDLMIKTFEYEEKIDKLLSKDSISIYIGIPFCPSRCSYCSFISKTYKNENIIEVYLDALISELNCAKGLKKRKIDSIYIGGGTPTIFNHKQLEKLLYNIDKVFNIESLKEYTIEAGRPDTISENKLKVIKSYNIDRISINPQTLNDKTLKIIGRNHTSEQFYNAFELASQFDFKVINTDIIAGLPEENTDDFIYTLKNIITLNPKNVTVHTLTYKRASQLNKAEKSKSHAEDMLNKAYEKLSVYLPYYLYRQKNTIDNLENVGYTKEGYECIYNMVMMGELRSVVSFGGGSVTKIIDEDNNILRFRNPKDADLYIKTIDDVVKKKEVNLYKYLHCKSN